MSAGVAAAQSVLDAAEEYRETTEETVARLAKLPPLEYDQMREKEAAILGVRVTTLDAEVSKARPQPVKVKGDDKQGRAVSFDEPTPWPQAVDGAELLDAIAVEVRRYVVMAAAAMTAIALWIVHTYLLDGFMISPRLAITSPEPRCGKTTLLRVLERLTPKAMRAASLTAPVAFRLVELRQPTLLIDEYDATSLGDDALRGILNDGHQRGGCTPRCVGDGNEVRLFATYCAVAIALIGDLPATLTDRSIPIRLQRRRKDELVEKFRIRQTERLDMLARQIARWAADNTLTVGAADPAMPVGMHDRAEDNWEPLLAIADVVGGDWPDKARQAARAFASSDDGDTSVGGQLLSDIKAIFAERRNADWLPSEEIAGALGQMEWPPWGEFGRSGKPITANGLARLLKPFGIRPGKAREDGYTPGTRGYALASFKDAFARYLSPETFARRANTATQPPQRHTPRDSSASEDSQPPQTEGDLAVGIGKKSSDSAVCGVVAVGEPESLEGEI
jgi:putative DNA primase/helicase